MLIARFYQRFSGEKTLYQLYLLPILLFGAQAVQEAKVAQDWVANLLAAAAGLLLFGLSILLYWRMTVGR